jgi:hypothetical protein
LLFLIGNVIEGPMKEMRCYRAYFLSASDHIRSVTIIRTADDASVSAEAQFLLTHAEHAAIEIWDGKRLVVRKERAQQVA